MKIPSLNTNHLLKDTDLTREEIIGIFNFAAKLKSNTKKNKKQYILSGKTLGMIFEKSSTRTRVSFECGMYQLGGHALFLSKNDIQIGRGEIISDTSRVLSRYVDGVMIRTYEQSKIDELAKYSTVSVINGLSDDYHPCQSLTDYFTIFEIEGLKKIKITYIGDSNNMANSLLLTGAILGHDVSIASPDGYTINDSVKIEAEKIALKTNSKISITNNIADAAKDADYLYTDVWASMGQESEAENRKYIFKNYKISKKLIQESCPNAKIMHCLPAHRGEEIDADVIESKNSIIFDQAENRMHLQKALLAILIK